MRRSRFTAVAIALALPAALAAAGCGLGPGATVGDASLTVTRDFGARPVVERSSGEIDESDSVMRVLEAGAEIDTRYGGGFVQGIEGLEADEGGSGGPSDWFFFVNGVESPIGAADYRLEGGEAIWWDYRNWSAASRVPAVVGSWPEPFVDGYEGKSHPVQVECLGAPPSACATVSERLSSEGASVTEDAAATSAGGDGPIRVLVGPWAQVSRDAAAAQIEKGPQTSGVYAEFESRAGGLDLVALGEDGEEARRLGPDAGLVAATRRYEDAAGLGRDRGHRRGRGAAAGLLDDGRPARPLRRCRRRRKRDPRCRRDEVAVRLRAAAPAAAGRLAGRRRHLPRRDRDGRLRLLQSGRARRRRLSPRCSPGFSPEPAARCGRRCGWDWRWRC